METTDELIFASTAYDDRERSNTPPIFAYSTAYTAPEGLLMNSYVQSQTYPTLVTTDGYPNYLAASAVPVTLPSLTHFNDAVKRETYQSDDGLSPYMSYGFVSGVDVNLASHYDQSNPHVSFARHLLLSRGPPC